jgi:hypothetical protein
MGLSPAVAHAGLPAANVRFNEIRADQVGVETDEFIEIAAPPGTVMSHSIVVLGDGAGGSGTVEAAFWLEGGTVGASGLFVIAEEGFSGSADLVTDLDLGDGHNLTLYLVDFGKTFPGDDVDTDDNGTVDFFAWGTVFDQVALVATDNPPMAGDVWHYGPPTGCVASPTCGQAGPTGGPAPMHIQRCADATGTWGYTQDDLAADTPGAPNACACGDGLVNTAAGEECDSEGESARCDLDCTAVECGDGVTNKSAGESCDDAGPSDTCDDDCTPAECGDGVVNPAAGEECDEAGPDCVDCLNIEGGTTGPSTTGADSTGAPPDPGDDSTGGAPVDPSTTSDGGSETGALSAGADPGAIESCGDCSTSRRSATPFVLWVLLAFVRRRRRA